MIAENQDTDPLEASLWRKLLALRVLLVSVLAIMATFGIISWFDSAKPDLPKWVEKGVIVLVCLPFFTFFALVAQGAQDIAVHFLPEGKFKRLMVGREKSSKELAREFASTGYAFALLPFIIWGALIALAIALVLLFGGTALASSMLGSVFAGWPPWAVVITILLTLILLKK